MNLIKINCYTHSQLMEKLELAKAIGVKEATDKFQEQLVEAKQIGIKEATDNFNEKLEIKKLGTMLNKQLTETIEDNRNISMENTKLLKKVEIESANSGLFLSLIKEQKELLDKLARKITTLQNQKTVTKEIIVEKKIIIKSTQEQELIEKQLSELDDKFSKVLQNSTNMLEDTKITSQSVTKKTKGNNIDTKA